MSIVSLLVAVAIAVPAGKPSADAEEPRAAAQAYFDAITSGDRAAALALVANPSEADRLVVAASAASARGLGGLEDFARSHLGDRGDIGVARRHRRLLDAVRTAPVDVKGDRAVLRPEGERPLRLRRVGGSWKIESPAERLTGEERRALRRVWRDTEHATKDLAARIRSGAVRSARELREALREALGPDDEGVPL